MLIGVSASVTLRPADDPISGISYHAPRPRNPCSTKTPAAGVVVRTRAGGGGCPVAMAAL